LPAIHEFNGERQESPGFSQGRNAARFRTELDGMRSIW
jgi:hypothetical protein